MKIEPPIARNNDPDTSKAAEAQYIQLGKRAVRQLQILELIRRYPNQTSGELARIFVNENPMMPILAAAETPHKRISDLMQKGMVMKSGKRLCEDSGHECQTYVLTPNGLMELERHKRNL